MFKKIITIGILGFVLSACQTTQESMSDAHTTCSQAGFKNGTENHAYCVANAYQNNRMLAEKRRDGFLDGIGQAGLIMQLSGR